MAKVAYSTLKIKAKASTKTIQFNQKTIEVKTFLPTQEKLQLLTEVYGQAQDGNRFYNPIKVEVYFTLAIMRYYTNLSFTDNQLADAPKLYDEVKTSGLKRAVFNAINDEEIFGLREDLIEIIKAMYKTANSAYGIIESIANDYSETSMSLDEINEKIANPETMSLLKDVVTKLA